MTELSTKVNVTVDWGQLATYPNGQTSGTPAILADSGGVIYLAYSGKSSSNLYASVYDGTGWSSQQDLGQESPHSPRMALFNGVPYMAFMGKSGAVYVGTYSSGKWGNFSKLSVKTNCSPFLATNGDVLYIIYNGYSSGKIWYISSADGKSWSDATTIPGATSYSHAAPAAVCYDGALRVIYLVPKTNILMHTAMSLGSSSKWSTPADIRNYSAQGSPSATAIPSVVFVATQGTNDDVLLGWRFGRRYFRKQAPVTGAVTSQGPSISVYMDSNGDYVLVLAFRDSSGNSIHYNSGSISVTGIG